MDRPGDYVPDVDRRDHAGGGLASRASRAAQPQLSASHLSALRIARRRAVTSLPGPSMIWATRAPAARSISSSPTPKHRCLHCRRCFNADMSDLALPKCHYTHRVQQTAVRRGRRRRTAVSIGQLAPVARPSRLRPLGHHPELGRGRRGKKTWPASRPTTSTVPWRTSAAISPSMSCTTARSACSPWSTTAPSPA